MDIGGDSIRVVHPLFQAEGDGSIPISPLQLSIDPVDPFVAKTINEHFHSRLPDIPNWMMCECYAAHFKNRYYAAAMWSIPSARALNGRDWLELRRFVICDGAPKNTASRMLRVMKDHIRKTKPNIKKLISYQDTDVHAGTIYKAAGWSIGNVGERIDETKKFNNWKTRVGRKNQSTAPKIRWEFDL